MENVFGRKRRPKPDFVPGEWVDNERQRNVILAAIATVDEWLTEGTASDEDVRGLRAILEEGLVDENARVD